MLFGERSFQGKCLTEWTDGWTGDELLMTISTIKDGKVHVRVAILVLVRGQSNSRQQVLVCVNPRIVPVRDREQTAFCIMT